MDLIEKLKIEIDELSERMDKLDIFIQSENFTKVSSAQQNLLIIQHSTMETYLKCLELRVIDLTL